METRQRSWGVWVSLALVQFYRIFLSHFFGGACKFHPSCSKYAQEAITRHGVKRGIVLALKRLGRCRPFTQGGFDPMPDICESKNSVTRNSARDFPACDSVIIKNTRFTENVLGRQNEERVL